MFSHVPESPGSGSSSRGQRADRVGPAHSPAGLSHSSRWARVGQEGFCLSKLSSPRTQPCSSSRPSALVVSVPLRTITFFRLLLGKREDLCSSFTTPSRILSPASSSNTCLSGVAQTPLLTFPRGQGRFLSGSPPHCSATQGTGSDSPTLVVQNLTFPMYFHQLRSLLLLGQPLQKFLRKICNVSFKIHWLEMLKSKHYLDGFLLCVFFSLCFLYFSNYMCSIWLACLAPNQSHTKTPALLGLVLHYFVTP